MLEQSDLQGAHMQDKKHYLRVFNTRRKLMGAISIVFILLVVGTVGLWFAFQPGPKQPQTVAAASLRYLTAEEYQSVNTKGIVNPDISDFRKLTITFSGDVLGKRKVVFPESSEISHVFSNGIDRYANGVRKDTLGDAEFRYDYNGTLFSRGSTDRQLADYLKNLKISITYEDGGTEKSKEWNVGQIVTLPQGTVPKLTKYKFTGQIETNVNGRTFALEDTPQNLYEEIVADDFRYQITGDFEKEAEREMEPIYNSNGVKKMNSDYAQGLGVQSNVIHKLETLSQTQFSDEDQKNIQYIEKNYDRQVTRAVRAVYSRQYMQKDLRYQTLSEEQSYVQDFYMTGTDLDPLSVHIYGKSAETLVRSAFSNTVPAQASQYTSLIYMGSDTDRLHANIQHVVKDSSTIQKVLDTIQISSWKETKKKCTSESGISLEFMGSATEEFSIYLDGFAKRYGPHFSQTQYECDPKIYRTLSSLLKGVTEQNRAAFSLSDCIQRVLTSPKLCVQCGHYEVSPTTNPETRYHSAFGNLSVWKEVKPSEFNGVESTHDDMRLFIANQASGRMENGEIRINAHLGAVSVSYNGENHMYRVGADVYRNAKQIFDRESGKKYEIYYG